MSNSITVRNIGPGETGIRLAARASKSLRENTAWNIAGSAVYAACQWGMLIILAKVGTPEMLGQFALALAVTAPVIMLFNLQLSAVQATDAVQRFKFSHYFALRILMAVAAGGVIAAVALTSGYNEQTRLIIMIIGLAKIVESISDILYGAMQQHERMDMIAAGNFLKGPLSLITLSLTLMITGDLFKACLALLAVWTCVLVLVDFRNAGSLIGRTYDSQASALLPRFEWKALTALAWQAAPLGVVMMLISLNYNIPRYFIANHFGPRELGIFAALAYILVATSMLVNALAQTASPRLARYIADRNRQAAQSLLIQLLLIALLIGAAGIAIAAVAGKPILSLLYRSEFAEHTDLLVWLMVAAAISHLSSVLGFFMTAARKFSVQVPLFACVCAASVIACAVLIPVCGLPGLALAMAAGFAVQFIVSAVVVIQALTNITPVSYEVKI
jgi:O-antigen/teichoic acid export membrane protein